MASCDVSGNICLALLGGSIAGDVEHRAYQRTNNQRVGRKPDAGEPYYAVLDTNLVRRTKWSAGA
jgi:hypothetical protein